MEIIRPEEKYFSEYYQACKESYENQVTEWMPFELDHFDTWKANILDAYARYEEGRDLPAGLPRTVTRWGVEGDTFIGELQVRPYLTEEEAKTWGHVAYAVRHSQWRKGYGTKLLQAALELLRQYQVHNIYLVCHAENQASIHVAQACGASLSGTMQDEDGLKQLIYLFQE